jgi:hypothetical protein
VSVNRKGEAGARADALDQPFDSIRQRHGAHGTSTFRALIQNARMPKRSTASAMKRSIRSLFDGTADCPAATGCTLAVSRARSPSGILLGDRRYASAQETLFPIGIIARAGRYLHDLRAGPLGRSEDRQGIGRALWRIDGASPRHAEGHAARPGANRTDHLPPEPP